MLYEDVVVDLGACLRADEPVMAESIEHQVIAKLAADAAYVPVGMAQHIVLDHGTNYLPHRQVADLPPGVERLFVRVRMADVVSLDDDVLTSEGIDAGAETDDEVAVARVIAAD